MTLALPGSLQREGWRIDAWVDTAPPIAWPDGVSTCVLDLDLAGREANVRDVEAGDRIRPLGMRGTKGVHDALAEIGVPAHLRGTRPIVTAGAGATIREGEPLWVVGYRVDDRVRVRAATTRFLWLAAARDEEAS